MDNELLQKRVEALEVEVQRLRITRRTTIVSIILGVAISDFVFTPLANLVIGLLLK